MSAAGGDDSTKATIAVKFTPSDKAAGQVSISLESTVGALKEAIRLGSCLSGVFECLVFSLTPLLTRKVLTVITTPRISSSTGSGEPRGFSVSGSEDARQR